MKCDPFTCGLSKRVFLQCAYPMKVIPETRRVYIWYLRFLFLDSITFVEEHICGGLFFFRDEDTLVIYTVK
jgi:hypothetical protein